MNPVWKRELRARWRGWRAFALVFFYVAVLAAVFLWQYYESHSRNTGQWSDPRQRLSLLGHELFVLLAWLQVLLWMFLSPILTATSITSEREKGLLEGLQLSRLSSWQIVVGKLLSALSLVALLLAVTLPITATCFLMGGVSPGEFGMVLALHAATAVYCAATGVAVSAWSRNNGAAIAMAIASVFAWSGLAFYSMARAFGNVFGARTVPAWPWNQLLELFAKAHPLNATLETVSILDGQGGGGMPWTTTTPSWAASFIFLLGCTLLWLWLAAIGTRRINTNSLRVEWQHLRKELHVSDSTNLQQLAGNAKAAPPPAKRWELGVLARWQFSNPILGREIRSCFRPRSISAPMLMVCVLLAPFAVYGYGKALWWVIFEPHMRVGLGAALLGTLLLIVMMLSSVLSAGSLVRERESGTWEALRLTLLSPLQVLYGKMGAPLCVCAVCALVFLPILLFSVRSIGYSQYNSVGLSLTQLIAAIAIIAACAWCCTSLGLLVSHYSRRAVTAICCTFGVLMVPLVVIPVFVSAVSSYGTRRALEDTIRLWHPGFALGRVLDRPDINSNDMASRSSVLLDALPPVLILAGLGLVCCLLLLRVLYQTGRADAR